MTDPARESLVRLMAEVDALEESAEDLQQQLRASRGVEDSQEREVRQRELRKLLERLDEKRGELTRISNACRRPHSNV
jgi:predicted transcriptional regulator of viral defense system